MKTQYTTGSASDVKEFITIISNMAVDHREGNQPMIEERKTGVFFFVSIYQYSISFIAEVQDPALITAFQEKLAWNKDNLFSQVPALDAASKTLQDARNDYIEKETDLIRESASSPKEFLDIKLSRDLFGEAEAATPDEYRAYCDASNKVFVGASGLHPNDYFKQLGVSVRF
tara:strand:+ start:250 stop:765 length:516 start_codon:yes stop_codon:yes gene_type:complete